MPQSNTTNTTKNAILGWDIGGAHLKVALIDQHGVALKVLQVPCSLWRGLNELDSAVDAVLSSLKDLPEQHAVTMTGELVDLFESRAAGVLAIAQFMRQKLQGKIQFYAGIKGFVPFEQVAANADAIASANWLASAHFLAKKVPNALFVDIGSTTSDLVPIADGKICAKGFSDAARMRSDELVYSGVVRTPLMALGQRVLFEQSLTNVAAEHFATTADVYRLTGDLLLENDMAETADGAGKSLIESARRIARMVGHDVEYASLDVWQDLAQSFKTLQLQRLQDAVDRVSIHSLSPLIGAGAGKFLVAAVAKKMDRPYMDVMDFICASSDEQKRWVGVCLPAYAVAHLALECS